MSMKRFGMLYVQMFHHSFYNWRLEEDSTGVFRISPIFSGVSSSNLFISSWRRSFSIFSCQKSSLLFSYTLDERLYSIKRKTVTHVAKCSEKRGKKSSPHTMWKWFKLKHHKSIFWNWRRHNWTNTLQGKKITIEYPWSNVGKI